MKINLSFSRGELIRLRSQIHAALLDTRLCPPYTITFDVSNISVSADFPDPFSGTDIFKHWED